MPDTYRLDVVADLVHFLKCENSGLWLVKSSTSNMGRGIEMVRDIEAYKESLLTKKDKWGESAVKPELKDTLLEDEETKEEAKEEVKVDAEKEKMKEERRTNLHRLVSEL